MANETLARRYALAVFQLAQQSGRIDAVGNDLSTIGRAVGEDPATREFFVSPIVDRDDTQRALASPAAQRLAERRIPEAMAPRLPFLAPPVWVFLHGLKSSLSSSSLRHRLG